MVSNKSCAPERAAKPVKKQYMTWLENADEIQGPRELDLVIRSMEPGRYKYGARHVRAIISPAAISEADILWVRRANGVLLPEPWSIKVIKELDDFFVERPYSGVVD
jgi:hypothetical protein